MMTYVFLNISTVSLVLIIFVLLVRLTAYIWRNESELFRPSVFAGQIAWIVVIYFIGLILTLKGEEMAASLLAWVQVMPFVVFCAQVSVVVKQIVTHEKDLNQRTENWHRLHQSRNK